jgi:cytochrome c-type biogenesis protein CcsB
MASLSDQLLVVTILAYLAAMLCYAAEYAFGARGVVARAAQREMAKVGATGPDGVDAAEASAADPADDSADLGESVPAEGPPGSRISQRIGTAATLLTVVGVLAQVATLVTRGAAAGGRVPWGNLYEFLLVLTLVGAASWLVVLRLRPAMRPLGLLVTAVLVVLLGAAGMVYTEAGPLVPALNSAWLRIHVTTVASAGGVLLVGFVSAVLYLLREGHEDGKVGFPWALAARAPAADALERFTFRVHAFAFPLLTVGVICGAIWAESAWGRYWGWDPKEIWSFITWVFYAGYLHARATPSVRRRVATYLALLGWTALIFNQFIVNYFFTGLHSYAGN